MPRVGRKSVRQAARASKGVPSKSTKIIEEWIDQHQVASTPANMKWAWEILDGKGSSSLCGHDVIAGWRYGGSLGIYQDKQDRWCITHLPTGWGLDGCFSKSREEVEIERERECVCVYVYVSMLQIYKKLASICNLGAGH